MALGGLVEFHRSVKLISVRVVCRNFSNFTMKELNIAFAVPGWGGFARKLLPKESTGKRILLGNFGNCPKKEHAPNKNFNQEFHPIFISKGVPLTDLKSWYHQ